MKNILICLMLSVLGAVSVQAQGLVIFSSGTQNISTNSVFGGAATGKTGSSSGQYYYALYCSSTATSVNGQTNAISGSSSGNYANYAFNDSAWTLVAYGTNTAIAGRFTSTSADSSGNTVVPGVAGGNFAQFVIIGWSANLGTNLSTLLYSLYGAGYYGWIGQSVVSGPLQLGDGEIIPSPLICGSLPPRIQAFTLGSLISIDDFTPPFIAAQPAGETVPVGADASFSVAANGNPSLTYQWSFNSSNILGAVNSTLTITNVQMTNAGSYSVFISNSAGSTNSSPAVLTVQPGAPPAIVSQPSNAGVPVGGSATFTVTASGSMPLNYQWSFNSTNLAGATNASLMLVDLQTNNAGDYAVAITNAYGTTNSAAAVLTVGGIPPMITSQPESLIVLAGSSAVFTVNVTGSTPFIYQWSLNNTNLAGATNAALTLADVQTNNAGSYAVSVSNGFGTTNSFAATLAVSAPQNVGYVIFATSAASVTKIYTNSAVDGPATGLTVTNAGTYCYALYASATATNVDGQTSAISGSDTLNYAFNDNNWTLVAYGINNPSGRGRLVSADTDAYGETAVPGFAGGTTVQFIVLGWSANIGTDIESLRAWFDEGNPAFDGWIGQSAVSGPIPLGDGAIIPASLLFGAVPPYLQGFTLGLASPNADAVFVVPYAPPALLQTRVAGNSLQLSWPTACGSFGVQSASTPSGPWSDTGWTVTTDGTNSMVTVPAGSQGTFFRLVPE
jgi:hypothetical protein